jgi:hypothetical protein
MARTGKNYQMNIQDLPPHLGSPYAGQVLKWLPTDTEENYHKHCLRSDYHNYVKNKGWDQPGAITYRINSLGYRGDEFDFDKPCVVTLGCSFSVGIGLPEQDVWPWRLGQALDLPVINLSWAGYSADTCFRLAEYFLPRINAKLCVMLAPPPDRIELVGPKLWPGVDFEVFMPSGMSDRVNANDMYLTQWMIHKENSRLNNLKNKLALEMLCSKQKINCLTYNALEFFGKSREEIEYARDYMHAGPWGHKLATDKILNDCTQK